MTRDPSHDFIELRIGREEVVLRQRYELLSIANDIAVAVWFIVGSILFFSASTTEAGTWLFLLGSVQLLVRPMIRLVRRVHVGRVGTLPADTARDF
ncbi:YrhK family protein [Solicola sp. PLA-1-18]|uniref:YrhK family protein n=1 Tax=Solicola sp. PLA-1-18 TaxID=3380532 RepID=UPI003B7EA574